jgi:hypothetical protein
VDCVAPAEGPEPSEGAVFKVLQARAVMKISGVAAVVLKLSMPM